MNIPRQLAATAVAFTIALAGSAALANDAVSPGVRAMPRNGVHALPPTTKGHTTAPGTGLSQDTVRAMPRTDTAASHSAHDSPVQQSRPAPMLLAGPEKR